MLAGFAYLLALRDAAVQEQQVVRAASSSVAVQQAAKSNSSSPSCRALEMPPPRRSGPGRHFQPQPDDLALVEKAMLDYFPASPACA